MLDSTLKNAKILIVDDQEPNVILLKDFLKLQGFTNILITTDPFMAVGLFESSDPDLILLDLIMPGISGHEVLAQLLQIIPKEEYLPIIVLSADITSSAKQRALARGARDFITKPFDFVEVFFRINNLLETRYYYQQLELKKMILEEKVEMVKKMIS